MPVTLVPSSTLAIERPESGEDACQSFAITNSTDTSVVFKVQLNSPEYKACSAKPSGGRLSPGEIVVVELRVHLKAFDANPRFNVKVVTTNISQEQDNAEPADIFCLVSKDAIHEHQLQVVMPSSTYSRPTETRTHGSGCFSLFSLFRKPATAKRTGNSSTTQTMHCLPKQAESLPVSSIPDMHYKIAAELQGDPHVPSLAPCCISSSASADFWRLGADEPVALPAYSLSGCTDVYRPEVLKTIERVVAELDADLRSLSLDIHSHPETSWKETHAHDALTKFIEERGGFEVTRHYKDLDTAWRAAYTHVPKGASDSQEKIPVLGVNSEMDALPGIGHACGHNLIATAGVGVALAIKAALEEHDIAGTIVLIGTPAEESGSGKITLIERGAYKEMDACVMSHPGGGPAHSYQTGPSLAVQSLEVEYVGHSAHAGMAPWQGTNALDAAVLAYQGIAVLRQQIHPDHRVHGILQGSKDMAPNVIPDYAKMIWLVRAPSKEQLDTLRERVLNCLKAAALATGCKHTLKVAPAVLDLRQNVPLANEFARTMRNRFSWERDTSMVGASTDFGNVTYELPALHPGYAIPTEPNGNNHTPGFTRAAATPAAHEIMLRVVTGLALTGFRLIDDGKYLAAVKKSYEEGEKVFM